MMSPLSLSFFRIPHWSQILQWALLLLFLILVYGPLSALLLDTISFVAADPVRAFQVISLSSRRLGLLFQTIALSAAVTGTVMLLGICAGSLIWQCRTGAGRYLFWAALLLIPLPLTVHALAWSTLLSTTGLLPGLIASQHSIQPWLLSWCVESMAFLPLGICISTIAFELVDPDRIQAARLLCQDLRVFSRIVLPLASPLLLAGAGFLWVFCLIDYTIPSIYAANVYPFEIFAEFSTSYLPAVAVLLAVPLLLVTIFLVLLSQHPLKSVIQNSMWTRREWKPEFSWPVWFRAVQRIALGIFIFQTGLVIVVLLVLAGAAPDLAGTLSLAREDAVTTVLICLGATLLAIPVALTLATRLVQNGPIANLWWILAVIPLAIPSPLIGIGMIVFWNTPDTVSLYGTLAMPVFAVIVRFLPFAALIIAAQLRSVDPLLLDAASIFGESRTRNFFSVYLPLILPGVCIAAAFIFAFGIGELGATLLVIPPGLSTLTIRLYNYLHYGSSESVAALGLLMTTIFLAIVLTGFILVRRRRTVQSPDYGDDPA
jgi:iron(III) transport system permease protein